MKFLICLAVAFVFFGTSRGQLVVDGGKMAPPNLDGIVERAEWAGARSVSGSWYYDGSPSPEACQYFLGFDDSFIYFAGKLADSRPETIRAVEYRTNAQLYDDDNVSISLDPTGRVTSASTFSLNPRGATTTSLAGGRASKFEWAGHFEAKARITPTGWEFEARIPWTLLSPRGSGAQTWRFSISRYIPRYQRSYETPHVPETKPDEFGRWKLTVPKLSLPTTMKLLPYGYGGVQDGQSLGGSGLDTRIDLGSRLHFVGTVNPDNRNIEQSILSLGFSHFERLAGESRPFFNEGRSYLPGSIFAPQRIPRFDLGAKLYGYLGNHTVFGVLDANEPGESNAVATQFRMRPNPLTNLSVGYTDMTSTAGSGSTAIVAVGRNIGTGGLSYGGSTTQDDQNGSGWSQNVDAYVSDKKGIWGGDLAYVSTSPRYFTRLGYTPEVDLKGFNTYLNYNPSYEKGRIRNVGVFVEKEQYRHQDNTPYRNSASVSGFIAVRNTLSFSAGYDAADFEGLIDRTRYVSLTFPENNPYKSVSLGHTWGYYNGTDSYVSDSVGGHMRIRNRLDLDLSENIQRFDGYADQAIFGFSYDMRNDRLLGGRLVKQGDKVNWNLTYQRSGNKGVETYVGLGDPNALSFRASLVLKVIWPLEVVLSKPHPPAPAIH